MSFLYNWRVALVILTGGFTLYGLLANFRDPDTKKITIHGKIAAMGAIISLCFGVIAQIKDNQGQIKNRNTFELRTTEILHEIKRTLSKMGRPEFDIELKIPCSTTTFPHLCETVSQAMSGNTNAEVTLDDWDKPEWGLVYGYLKPELLTVPMKHPNLTVDEQKYVGIAVSFQTNSQNPEFPKNCPLGEPVAVEAIVNLDHNDRYRFRYDPEGKYIVVWVHLRSRLYIPLRVQSSEDIKYGGLIIIALDGMQEISVIETTTISTPSEDIIVSGFQERKNSYGEK